MELRRPPYCTTRAPLQPASRRPGYYLVVARTSLSAPLPWHTGIALLLGIPCRDGSSARMNARLLSVPIVSVDGEDSPFPSLQPQPFREEPSVRASF